MGRRVKKAVVLSLPLGGHAVLLPGDEVPDDVADLITNPAVFEGDLPSDTAGAGEAPSTQETTTTEADDAPVTDDSAGDVEDDEPEYPETPPRTGKGSGKQAWVDYADRIGVDVEKGADREAIIAAVDEALAE